jgi:ribonuclease BN (tRNA processing enzyme)
MASPKFPLPLQALGAKKNIRNISEHDVIRLGESGEAVYIRALRSYAHPQGVMSYRIEWKGKSVVYATDTEGYQGGDRRLIEFARGADLLIHDAQYSDDHYLGKLDGAPVTQGFGHATAAMACKIADAADVGSLVLFHHDPNYDDSTISSIECQAREQFINTAAAREGQEINLLDPVIYPEQEDTDCVGFIFESEAVTAS